MTESPLVRTLRCPRCEKLIFGHDPELFRGTLRCERKSCGQRWWATALSAGSVRAQLLEQFEDEGIVTRLMVEFQLPDAAAEPCFWQIPITGHQAHRFREDGSVLMLRTIVLERRTA